MNYGRIRFRLHIHTFLGIYIYIDRVRREKEKANLKKCRHKNGYVFSRVMLFFTFRSFSFLHK